MDPEEKAETERVLAEEEANPDECETTPNSEVGS
jgi:hypothetical protein